MSRRPRALHYTLPVLPSTEIKLTMNQVYNIVNININFLSIITHTPLPYREPLSRSDNPVILYDLTIIYFSFEAMITNKTPKNIKNRMLVLLSSITKPTLISIIYKVNPSPSSALHSSFMTSRHAQAR